MTTNFKEIEYIYIIKKGNWVEFRYYVDYGVWNQMFKKVEQKQQMKPREKCSKLWTE